MFQALTQIGSTLTPASQSAGTSNSTTDKLTTTKDQFLKLLLAQLKQQDPLEAPDASKLSEQITAFGQLEQMFNMNSSLENISKASNNADQSQAVSLIGKKITSYGDSLSVSGADKGLVGFSLGGNAKEVTVSIKDSAGKVVRTIRYENVTSGIYTDQFDGKNDAGADLPEGKYTMETSAVDPDKAPMAVKPVFQGVVTGVQFSPQGAIIQAGNGTFNMGQILSVNG